jgi:hypothetical protein
MEQHDEEENSRRVGLSLSKKESPQRPLAEPVGTVPARRLPPREGCAPSFRLKPDADLLMGEGDQKRAQIQEVETKPKRQANQRRFYKAASLVIRPIKTQAGGPQDDAKQSISPSPDSPQQKTTSTRWNDKSAKPKRELSQRRLHRAASMRGLAFKVSDPVDKDILNDDDDAKMTAMVDDGGSQPSKKVQKMIEMFSQSCMNLNFEQPISCSPDFPQQKRTSARWNDKSDQPKRRPSQRLLSRAASMQGLAFKVSDPVDKDILDDDDVEMTAVVDDEGNQPSQKTQETIKMFSQSCMNLNFEHQTSDGPDVEVFQKSKAQIDDDEPDIEVFRPSPSQRRRSSSSRNLKQSIDNDESDVKVLRPSPLQRRMSSSSRNLKHSMAQVDDDEYDESNVKVLRPSPSERRLSSSSSQRRLSSSSSQRRLSSSSSQRRLSSSSSQRRLSSSSSQRRLSTSSRRPLKKQEEEQSHTLQRSLTDLSPPSRSDEARWVGAKILEKSLTDLAPQTRPSGARRVRSSDLAQTKDLERSLTKLERSPTDLARAQSSEEEKSRPNFEPSLTAVAETLFTKFEKSITDLGLTRSTDVERLLSEVKKSLTDFARVKVSDLDPTDSSEERPLHELVGANSFEQQCRKRTGHASADLRDNTSCSSISVDDLYEQQEPPRACHNDGTRSAPVSHEKENLSYEHPTKRDEKKDTLESFDGEPCDSRHFESSLHLSSIYIMSDLKNESNSSMYQNSDESLHHSKLSPERIPEVEQQKVSLKKMVELAVERSVHDSPNSSSRNNASLQGSSGHVRSTSIASSFGVFSWPKVPQGGRDQSPRTPKEENRNRCEVDPTSNPARIRRAPSRSYSMYSGTNSFLDDIADVSDEEESTATDQTKEKKSGRRGRRRHETHDAKLARIQRETVEQDLHRSLEGSFEFQL